MCLAATGEPVYVFNVCLAVTGAPVYVFNVCVWQLLVRLCMCLMCVSGSYW